MDASPELLSDDVAALRAIIAAQQAEIHKLASSARAYEALIEALRIQILRLKKQKYGASSEKIAREIEQLELALEGLEIERAAADLRLAESDEEPAFTTERPTPRRRGKPRLTGEVICERIVLDPGACCPACGGALRLVGEDVGEILDFVQAQLKLVETARLKKSCRRCEAMVQSPAPTRPVRRGMAGPGLLAHILVSKFDDHLPLYRQGEILARSRSFPARASSLARVTELLGEDEDLLHEISIEMEPEDGMIGVHGLGDDYTPAFTDFGIENLRYLIELHKADARRSSELVATKRDPAS